MNVPQTQTIARCKNTNFMDSQDAGKVKEGKRIKHCTSCDKTFIKIGNLRNHTHNKHEWNNETMVEHPNALTYTRKPCTDAFKLYSISAANTVRAYRLIFGKSFYQHWSDCRMRRMKSGFT